MTILDEPTAVLCIVLIIVIPLAIAGLALLNAGLGRSRSAAQSLLGALCAAAVACIAFSIVGFSFAGFPGLPSYTLNLGSHVFDWIGAGPLFLSGLHGYGSIAGFAAGFHLMAISLLVLIPWGAGADRWRLSSICVVSGLIGCSFYPVFAHWVWGGGWLADLGPNFHLGSGFLDPGGAATVQAFGGLTALATVWTLGPRRTKFVGSEAPRAIPGHHMIYVLLGCLLLLPGWAAFNALGAVLFANLKLSILGLVVVNTLLSAVAALLAALLVTRLRFGKPDVSLCANGWVAGLVTSCAIAAHASPASAMVAGAIIGGALPFIVEFLEAYGRIDDPSGAISVHSVSALWGLLALSFVAGFPPGQLLAQLIGIGTLIGLVFPALYLSFLLLNKALPFRTDPEGERIGMDLHELGAGAYPEFVIYGDDFLPR